jgi:DNA-binding response OmpR family regulator
MHPEGPGTVRVLIVEDEADIRVLLTRILESEGFEVLTADGALSAVQLLVTLSPNLVLLDVGLPGVDGLEVLDRIRKLSAVPVIMLTGHAEQRDRVAGLRGGADDYIVKPFSSDELLARIESVLRRAPQELTADGGSRASETMLRFDGLTIDCGRREVEVSGTRATMTAREFDLLAFLARSPRQVFTRGQLLLHVWDSSDAWQDDATVTEHVRRVRRKIEQDPDRPSWVVTVRGVGYRFEP